MTVSRRRAAVGLPVLPEPPPALRADAARNRAKLLRAAADLFGARGVEAVSLDDVVSAAGVGKGTLYRIFGDKSGLAAALLDEQERDLQERVLSGPPPLGPGAGGRARLFDRMQKQFLTGVYDPPDFALRLLHKDVSLACQLGREVSVPMRLTNMAHQELTEAMNRGWQQRDSRVGSLLQQERAGIPPIAVDPARIKAVMDADEG